MSELDFSKFQGALHAQYHRMLETGRLFRTGVDVDGLWITYIDSFPPGTNPVFRERTEHDCTCCKQFIRQAAAMVAVDANNKLMTLFDIETGEPAYDAVAKAMAEYVRSEPIVDVFMHIEEKIGRDRTAELTKDKKSVVRNWEHFFLQLPSAKKNSPGPAFVVKKEELAPKLAEQRDNHQVLLRGLKEFSLEAIEKAFSMIRGDDTGVPLYKGEEQVGPLKTFKALKERFDQVRAPDRSAWVWSILHTVSPAIARMRNHAIGTLLIDLAEGMPLDQAEARWNKVVAPENYKRPQPVITQKMIDSAMKTIQELDLEPHLSRRFANIGDITVNNVLWVDRASKAKMKGSISSLLSEEVVAAKQPDDAKAEPIAIKDFMEKIVPSALGMDVFLKNRHQPNMVSLTTAQENLAPKMFLWPNNFGWSYHGNIADSQLRKAVQARGGSVTGAFRFSHQWNYDKRNASLMDLHVFLPTHRMSNGQPHPDGVHETYGNTERVGWNWRGHKATGGVQDVDYVDPAPKGYIPVENTTFPDLRLMPEGKYVCKIHNWSFRAPTEGGFRAEIEFGGQIFQYEHPRPLKHHEWVTVAEVTLKNGVFTIDHKLPHASSSQDIWGLKTEQFVKVRTMLYSPNYWDDNAIGNRHYFFILDGCKNPEPARGIYNEFLVPELEQNHRRVFEVLGNKTKCEVVDNQLSGVGFSSTQRNDVLVSVKTAKSQRLYNVLFNQG